MSEASRTRLILLSIMVVCFAAAIGVRLYRLQIERSDEFRTRAASQHQSRITVQAIRGAIVDREGRELAVSLETHSLYAHPSLVTDPQRAAKLLAPVIGESPAALRRRLESDKAFVYLRRFLDAETAAVVREMDLPGSDHGAFGLDPEPQRVYPRGELAVHVVGYASIDGDGVEGIEKRYDDLLRGDASVYLMQQDARNGHIRKLIHAPDRQPHDVVLSIDLVLQHIVERALERAMRETGARAASAVFLDPATGEVLALANRPAADPNQYERASEAEKTNRALVHVYEPGSTFKFVPMAAALELGVARPGDRIYCENGLYRTAGRSIHDVSPSKTLTVQQILEKSSNIGMVKLARKLPPEAFYGAIHDFGFGSKTGIELTGESRGLLAPVPEWSSFTQASLSFGQEIAVNALQMAQALATIANNGERVPPRVVLGTRDRTGHLDRAPRPRAVRVISKDTARALQRMMESVVERGTGTRARVPGYRVGGKSGTAQKALREGGYSESEYFSSFGGFAPLADAKLAGLVILDSPRGPRHQGGQVAAPVFGGIMTEALRHLRVPPDSGTPLTPERLTASNVPVRAPAAPATLGSVPDVRGLSLREAISRLAAHGFQTSASGSGMVVSQQPRGGTKLAVGRTCRLALRRPETSGASSRSSS